MRRLLQRDAVRTVGLVASCGLVLPFGAGLGLVAVLGVGRFIGPAANHAALILVFGMAVAVTSIPVISRIMHDLDLLTTRFASIVLSSAVVEDIVLYVVLAVAVGLVHSAGSSAFGVPAALNIHLVAENSIYHSVVAVLFLGVALTAGPRAYRSLIAMRANPLRRSPVAFQLLWMLALSAAELALGLVLLYGALVAGTAVAVADDSLAVLDRNAPAPSQLAPAQPAATAESASANLKAGVGPPDPGSAGAGASASDGPAGGGTLLSGAGPATATPASTVPYDVEGNFSEPGGQVPVPTPKSAAAKAVSAKPTWTAVVTADRAYFDGVVAEGETGRAVYRVPRRLPGAEIRAVGNRDADRAEERLPRAGTRDRPDGPPTDPGISHLHAVLIAQQDGSWSVLDRGSSNGTQVNGHEIAAGIPVLLRDGDRVCVGAWTALTIHSS